MSLTRELPSGESGSCLGVDSTRLYGRGAQKAGSGAASQGDAPWVTETAGPQGYI